MHSLVEAGEILGSPYAAEELAGSLFVVDVTNGPDSALAAMAAAAPMARALACVTVAVEEANSPRKPLGWKRAFDIVLGEAAGPEIEPALESLRASLEANPQASVTAAQVLRATHGVEVASGLTLESAAYSMLQAGPEFARWRASRVACTPAGDEAGPPVIVERTQDKLVVTLNRPHVRNAVNAASRDGLVEALRVGACDPAVGLVLLKGAGPAFCSGGDLGEFGTLPDPATAHQIRMTRSPAWWAASLRPRLRVELHGACVGAGIELAAWAGEIVAREDTFALLPEVSMGLIPGAGGTVSLPRRIGRHRSAYMAISGQRIDVDTLRAWGLVDRIEAVG